MINTIKTHIGYFLYQIVLLLIFIGVIKYSGFEYIHYLLIVLISFNLFYWIGDYFLKNKLDKINHKVITFFSKINFKNSIYYLFGFSILIILFDIYFNTGLPGFKIFGVEYLSEVVFLRENIHTNSPSVIKYLSGFNIRTILPFLILYFYITKNHIWLYISLIIGALYSFGMLQKSFIIFMLIPTILYLLLQKKWLFSAVLFSVIFINFYVIISTATSKINDLTETEEVEIAQDEIKGDIPTPLRVILGIRNRVVYLPGEIVSKWFEYIPEKKPFLYGRGYPVINHFYDEGYIDYNTELYRSFYPEHYEKGVQGSVNAATFMREYSNFGSTGLILSSLMVSVFLLFTKVLFKNYFSLFVSINLFYILF